MDLNSAIAVMQIEKGIAEFNLANGKGNQHTQEFIRRMGETPQCFNNRCKRGYLGFWKWKRLQKRLMRT